MELTDALPNKEIETDGKQLETPTPVGLTSREFNLKTADLIKSQIGEIEEVRRGLGLSKRKMCQLLLIDPSTWTRWSTGKTTPPPYVYRMLQWGLAVMDRYPETHPLVQYEKFEQVQKIKQLQDRLDELENKTISEKKKDEKYAANNWFSLGLFVISAILLCLTFLRL